jgi:hypothetical protein
VRGRLAAYAGYQLRDFLLGRAAAIVLVTALAVWAYAFAHALTPAILVSPDIDAPDKLQRAFEFALAVFAIAGAAVAAHGVVSYHRARGYDRLMFSRPLSPARYYLQGLATAGIGTLLLATVGAGVYGVVARPVSSLGVAAYVALAWVAVGGLAFLLSAATAAHVPVLVALLAADLTLDRYATGLRAAGNGNVALDAMQYLLPPGHVVVALAEPFARGSVIDSRAVWPLGFGLACLAVAVILLRRRPFRT